MVGPGSATSPDVAPPPGKVRTPFGRGQKRRRYGQSGLFCHCPDSSGRGQFAFPPPRFARRGYKGYFFRGALCAPLAAGRRGLQRGWAHTTSERKKHIGCLPRPAASLFVNSVFAVAIEPARALALFLVTYFVHAENASWDFVLPQFGNPGGLLQYKIALCSLSLATSGLLSVAPPGNLILSLGLTFNSLRNPL